MINFAAPEMFDKGADADGHEVHTIQSGRKTEQTDVYAFGCLCYAVSINTLFGAHDSDSSGRYSLIPCLFNIYPGYKSPPSLTQIDIQHDYTIQQSTMAFGMSFSSAGGQILLSVR